MKGRIIVSTLLALLLLVSMPMSALAATWDISKGDITVNAESGGQTVRQGGGAAVPDSAPVITGTSKENNVTINAESGQTASVTLSGVNIDVRDKGKAAVSTTGEGNVSIELNGESTLRSGYEHAGLEKNNGGSLTIADEDKNGKLTAWGEQQGAGIGGGSRGSGSDITISGDSQVKATGGAKDSVDGCGAAIGNGGNKDGVNGSEVEPDTSGLSPTGKVERIRGDGTVLDTIIGTVKPPKSPSSEEEADKREPLYRVLHLDGSNLKHQAQKADGVLALTAKADGAILTGTLRALGYLQNQGIEKITFTDGTHSAELVLAELIAKGQPEDVYVLTLGAENTLTLNGEAIDFLL